jgi:hypothetical protein
MERPMENTGMKSALKNSKRSVRHRRNGAGEDRKAKSDSCNFFETFRSCQSSWRVVQHVLVHFACMAGNLIFWHDLLHDCAKNGKRDAAGTEMPAGAIQSTAQRPHTDRQTSQYKSKTSKKQLMCV